MDSTPTDSLRPVPVGVSKKLLLQWHIDFRFVREVERLEREGRVKSRGHLEGEIGMSRGYLAGVRRGRYNVGMAHTAQLKRLYNADVNYILLGQRVEGLSEPIIWEDGRKKELRRYPGYMYQYGQPAGFNIGNQPETHPDYYPPDPDNRLWEQHPEANPKARQMGQYKLAGKNEPQPD